MGGWTTQSKFSRAESQGDDLPNNETCSVNMAELWQRMVECGKEDMATEYNERNVSGASNGEQEAGNINGTRGGLVHIVLDGWVISELEEGSSAEKDFGDPWCWLAWKLQKRKMVASSF